MNRLLRNTLIAGGVLAIGAGGYYAVKQRQPTDAQGQSMSASTERIKLHTVTRDPMRVAIVEEGRLRAAKNHLISSEIRSQLKITWLAPEGSSVKKGDPLIRFDKKQFEDELNRLKGELETSLRQLEVNEEAVIIQEATGRSMMAAADTRLGDAEVALRTYRNLDAPTALNTIEKNTLEARTRLTDAQRELDALREQLDAELFEETQRAALDQKLVQLEQSARTIQGTIDAQEQQRRIFRTYDYPRNMAAKQRAVDNARLEVEKSRSEAKSTYNQKISQVQSVKSQIARHQNSIATLEDQIRKCEILAPADGLVIYGNSEQDRGYSRNTIQVGADWYGGNVLMTIPETSNYIVDIQLPEEYRGRVLVGAPASITIEAVPGLTLTGKLIEIANLARPRIEYDPSSPKVFASKIQPEGLDERLVSGMTARVEIITDELADALQVPIESVFNVDSKIVCFVKGTTGVDTREVTPGKSSDHYVEILAGLTEGEKVFTSNPLEK